MKAIVCSAKEGLVLRELPDPAPGPGEVLLRIRNCGICGSDLFLYKNGILRDGLVMGHELSGIVESVGAGIGGISPGDRVIARPQGCKTCKWCRAGLENLCTQRRAIGLGARPGGFAELLLADEDMIIPVPDACPLDQACMADQFGSALHGLHCVDFKAGETALVTGAGPIGLSAVMLLRNKGASKIVVAEPGENRAALAVELGADATFSPATKSMSAGVREHFGADGPDCIFECSGATPALEAAIQVAPFGGRIALVGMASAPAKFIPMVVFQKHLLIVGCFGNTQAECRESMDIMASGTIPSDRIITKKVGIEQVPAAFDELIKSKDQIKIVMEI